jgi:hypothetical protein
VYRPRAGSLQPASVPGAALERRSHLTAEKREATTSSRQPRVPGPSPSAPIPQLQRRYASRRRARSSSNRRGPCVRSHRRRASRSRTASCSPARDREAVIRIVPRPRSGATSLIDHPSRPGSKGGWSTVHRAGIALCSRPQVPRLNPSRSADPKSPSREHVSARGGSPLA